MDSALSPEGSARAGTVGGTLTVLLTLSPAAVLETALLAAVGAAVSYGVSMGLKALHRRWQQR
jgi:uncharacterized membrane protein